MTDTKDYRWFAADTVMRKSTAALQALLKQGDLIQLHADGATGTRSGTPVEDGLLLETQRAIDMAREALADLPIQEQ
ncbi:MAG: hypothetical protein M3P30_12185 [Chloroflexota bacterium]|nr:hypothetical protein [Chloroflexota bacterium]